MIYNLSYILDSYLATIGLDITHKTMGLIGADHNLEKIVIAFKGSTKISDWLSSLSTSLRYKTPCIINGISYGNSHAGFCAFFNAIKTLTSYDVCLSKLHKAYPDYAIAVTGHSLGGALAAYAAIDIVNSKISQSPILYTFGQPRTGDNGFNKILNSLPNIHRITNKRDIVPQ